VVLLGVAALASTLLLGRHGTRGAKPAG